MKHRILANLNLPVLVAPMFIVSGVELVLACCKAGLIGSFPALNGRTANEFESMLCAITEALRRHGIPEAPYAVNVSMRTRSTERFEQDLATIERYKVPIIITSVGDPAPVVDRVHRYGGIVLHDVINLQHARKAASSGVDGLILVCAGAGGHSGAVSPFAMVPQVREFFKGIIALAGAISDGRSIRAAEVLGADIAYMGTRFIATAEADAQAEYKDMLVEQHTEDVVYTNAFSSVWANFMEASIRRVGMDPARLPSPKGLWQPDLPEGVKAWRDVWSGGHGVGLIRSVPSVAELAVQLACEYREARNLDSAQIKID